MKNDRIKSIKKRIENQAKARGLTRDDAFTAYAMDRLLFRLGRSMHSGDFLLKGGVLVASLLGMSHRFTRDIDVLRKWGPSDPDDLREMFRKVVALEVEEDGLLFREDGVRAVAATRDDDGYDGVKVTLHGAIGSQEIAVHIDIGFGDAVVPPAARMKLPPFLDEDEPARVWAYGVEPVVSEKVETLLSKFPVIRHRLKDVLDVIVLAERTAFDGGTLTASMRATFQRRGTRADIVVLDDMRDVLAGREWETAWAQMVREKAVQKPPDLREAIERFDAFVRLLLEALRGGTSPGRWEPGGPWEELR